MPTVLRFKGHRFYFYSHEPNEPPHVHVDKGGATLKAWLDPVALGGSAASTMSNMVAIRPCGRRPRSSAAR